MQTEKQVPKALTFGFQVLEIRNLLSLNIFPLFFTTAGNIALQDLSPVSDYVMGPAVIGSCSFPHDQSKDI
jgi:hypothetical protein